MHFYESTLPLVFQTFEIVNLFKGRIQMLSDDILSVHIVEDFDSRLSSQNSSSTERDLDKETVPPEHSPEILMR